MSSQQRGAPLESDSNGRSPKTKTKTTAWLDLINPSDPFFFRGLVDAVSALETEVTTRRKTETVGITEEVGFEHTVTGRDFDNTVLRKLGIPLRTLQLLPEAPSADVSLSLRNAMCVLASALRGTPSIHFTDNDITAYVDGYWAEELYNQLEAQATYNIVPSAFETSELTKWGSPQIFTYDGYKEDVYVADFDPDPAFTDILPVDEYIVVRPEALDAAYVEADGSLVPAILSHAVERGFDVVYLPRGRGDVRYAEPYSSDEVFVPNRALDGLQLAWHSECVLTGSGTMAREAACLGKSAVSFFPNPLLSVDRQMVKDDRILQSRDAREILAYVEAESDTPDRFNRERSVEVKDEVARIVEDIIHW